MITMGLYINICSLTIVWRENLLFSHCSICLCLCVCVGVRAVQLCSMLWFLATEQLTINNQSTWGPGCRVSESQPHFLSPFKLKINHNDNSSNYLVIYTDSTHEGSLSLVQFSCVLNLFGHVCDRYISVIWRVLSKRLTNVRAHGSEMDCERLTAQPTCTLSTVLHCVLPPPTASEWYLTTPQPLSTVSGVLAIINNHPRLHLPSLPPKYLLTSATHLHAQQGSWHSNNTVITIVQLLLQTTPSPNSISGVITLHTSTDWRRYWPSSQPPPYVWCIYVWCRLDTNKALDLSQALLWFALLQIARYPSSLLRQQPGKNKSLRPCSKPIQTTATVLCIPPAKYGPVMHSLCMGRQ
jgi:hypothetical protein